MFLGLGEERRVGRVTVRAVALLFDAQDVRGPAIGGEQVRPVLGAQERRERVRAGEEAHEVDQILVFVDGDGEAVLNKKKSKVGPGSLVEVPAGTLHNFVNTGDKPLKLYTIYAPPEEEPDTVHKTKAEAEAAEAKEHGKKGKKK